MRRVSKQVKRFLLKKALKGQMRKKKIRRPPDQAVVAEPVEQEQVGLDEATFVGAGGGGHLRR